MKILAIANNKGGVGKTTAAQNIGAALAKFTDKKTLLIDLDPQASLSKSFGIYLDPGQAHIGSFILGKANLNDIRITYKGVLDIIPSSKSLLDEEEAIRKSIDFPFTLSNILKKINEVYDFILIDCPPALGTLTKTALVACDRYYIPLQAEYFSYEGLRDFIEYANQINLINPAIQLGGVFANRFNPYSRKTFSRTLVQAVKEQLGEKFLKSYIRENIALSEAQAKGMDIFNYDVDSKGSEDYYNLTKEIIVQ